MRHAGYKNTYQIFTLSCLKATSCPSPVFMPVRVRVRGLPRRRFVRLQTRRPGARVFLPQRPDIDQSCGQRAREAGSGTDGIDCYIKHGGSQLPSCSVRQSVSESERTGLLGLSPLAPDPRPPSARARRHLSCLADIKWPPPPPFLRQTVQRPPRCCC